MRRRGPSVAYVDLVDRELSCFERGVSFDEDGLSSRTYHRAVSERLIDVSEEVTA